MSSTAHDDGRSGPGRRQSGHRHRPHTTRTLPFFGPVSTNENPAAHGGVCEIDMCRCGASRRTNVNGTNGERGPWVEEGGGR